MALGRGSDVESESDSNGRRSPAVPSSDPEADNKHYGSMELDGKSRVLVYLSSVSILTIVSLFQTMYVLLETPITKP